MSASDFFITFLAVLNIFFYSLLFFATDSFAYSISFGLECTITASIILLTMAGFIAWRGIKRKVVPANIWDTAA